MLSGFMIVVLTAVAAGIAAGRYVALNNLKIQLVPPVYMRQLVFFAPVLMVAAVIGLFICLIKYRKNGTTGKLPMCISVWVYTVMGIMASGFCGMYQLENFLPIAVAGIMGVLVLLTLVVLPLSSQIRIRSRYNLQTESFVKKAIFVAYGLVVILSAFMPVGPLPVIITGAVWMAVIYSEK